MDEFCQFALAHGLVITDLSHGRITRCKTVDHPHKKNGAFLFNGEWGWVQDWAKSDKVNIWIGKESKITPAEVRQKIQAANKEREHQHQEAARKAAWMISKATPGQHDYLASKGFADAVGLVMKKESGDMLLIPMRIENTLVGLQIIAKDAEGYRKTFLKGSRTKGACFVIGRGGKPIYCEGYVTGLSVHRALDKSKLAGHVVVCFSAANMAAMAKTGFVIADNDASRTGEIYAKETGLPYYMPETVGFDFNDEELALGQFPMMLKLKKLLTA